MPRTPPFDPNHAWRLGTLTTLQAAAQATVNGLLVVHPELNDPSYRARMTRRGVVARSILRQIERLSNSLLRYQAETDRRCPPPQSMARFLAPTTVSVPKWWSPQEADAVFEFLSSMAQAVWEAHEPGLVDIAIEQCEMERHALEAPSPPSDDMPF
jgi:hypothetical protein